MVWQNALELLGIFVVAVIMAAVGWRAGHVAGYADGWRDRARKIRGRDSGRR